jgi:hypothetical protein
VLTTIKHPIEMDMRNRANNYKPTGGKTLRKHGYKKLSKWINFMIIFLASKIGLIMKYSFSIYT